VFRVSRRSCEDGPLLDDQETEGQRQLHRLLLQQLHTDTDIERCVAKRRCFAPAALYRPFGEQAEGVRSLSQFQALQDGEQELASLRELGLTEPEIQLWQRRDVPESAEKGTHGVCATPGAKQQRLQAIRDKIAARAELLSRPQRFATSRPLSRREMEIEQALFQGNDRLGFLTALYHRGNQDCQLGEPSSDPIDSVYRAVLMKERRQASPHDGQRDSSDQSHDAQRGSDQSEEARELQDEVRSTQPIGSLRRVAGVESGSPLTLRGTIEMITDEEIMKNREPDEGIRSIPRFRDYRPGEPSKVLCVKNLSKQASVAQLVALFSRFERKDGPPLRYRLLTGRMKGQAFVTLPDAESARSALRLLHGYRGLGKPLVVEFGRERQEEQQ
uniref:RNA-binding protein 41 n=1 Tax=Mola mola TaxID=94237 RepID=A0A3Q3WV22_MOLML